MLSKVIICTVVLNLVFLRSKAILSEEFEVEPSVSGNAPFFELPCMAVGGTCARPVACPRGTTVGIKGLCPVQQELGMECCRPPKYKVKCTSEGGQCVAVSEFKCPKALKISDATDCDREEVCCILENDEKK